MREGVVTEMNHRMGSIDVRRFAVAAFTLIMAFAMLASFATGNASAKKKPKKAKVTLNVTTKNQAALLKSGKLTVKVKSTAKAKVKLAASHAGKSNRFKAKTVKFKKKGTKKITLALTSGGKKALGTCGAKTVKVTATYKKGKKKAKANKSKKLAKDNSRCGRPKPPDPVVPVKSTCDPLDPKVCMQPFPSDFYTKADPSSETGVRLDIPLEAMPKNTDGTPINLPDLSRADGFSPGNLITTRIPEVDNPAAFVNSGIVPITDPGSYADPEQAVVVFDADTGARQPIWAELDANPTTKSTVELTPGQPPVVLSGGSPNDDPTNTDDVNLIIRTAKNYTPGKRYIVAIRNLKDASNNAVQPAAPFKACIDDQDITDPALLYRCNQLQDKVFPNLPKAGINKDGLYLAWDFTVASQKSITGRMTTIRDDAFKRLGDQNLADRKIDGDTPEVDITSFCDSSDTGTAQCGGAAGQSPVPGTGVKRYVDGFIRNSPCYLDTDGCATGAKFEFNDDGSLKWNPAYKVSVPFRCLIPDSTVAGGTVHPAKTGIYGHGLLGTLNQVRGQADLANRQNSVWCATNFDGFADNDLGTVAASLKDLSNFSKLTDRMQQGFVNFMMLGRAALHEDGLASEPEFSIDPDGPGGVPASSVIDVSDGEDQRGYYHGVNQGGIMGGALTAVDPDVDRGVLNVPGINYSTLLARSVDFDEYAHGIIGNLYIPGVGLYDNYTNKAEYPVIFSIMQLLWDRGEGNGYVQAMNPANPNLPNTNPHRVLLQVAYGDHQVANVAAETEARTLGAVSHAPLLPNGRHWASDPAFGLNTQFGPISTDNNIMVYYDGGPETYNCTSPGVPTGCRGQGSKTPPNENVPPRPEWGYGGDPHGYPRAAPDGMQQAEDFLDSSQMQDCTGVLNFCWANGYTGS